MADSLHALRRAATRFALRQAISATAGLPIGRQRAVARSLVGFAGGIPPLRRRVRENMRLALGRDAPVGAERLYFHHLGWLFASSLSVFHHGLAATPVVHEVRFDDSVRLLDDAVAQGRGVVLTLPHWSGHELAAAMVNRRHPVAILGREAPDEELAARKHEWYRALGAEAVLRPRHGSTPQHAFAYLEVLRRGACLLITPDLLADPGQGVEARLFGRRARLHPGAFALAISAGAPMIRLAFEWQGDSGFVIACDRPPVFDGRDRDAIRAGVADWCCWFEEKLAASPENWLFWLDKRWSRFLRATARSSG
jgi:lauroyl/myristoyl acyltransferase